MGDRNFEVTYVLFASFRRVIEKIDQTEFEGFEYVNPLLMSLEDCVWQDDPGRLSEDGQDDIVDAFR